MLSVVHPAASLHVRLVDTPEGELLLEERTADIVGTMQLPCAVIVKDESKGVGVTVKEKLVGFGVIVKVTERIWLREPGQAGPRQRLQRAAVSFVPNPPAVYYYFLAV